MKIITVYYSRKGENYWNGSIKNLRKGNTEIVAEFVQRTVGGDLFEVETVKPHSEDYYRCIDEAQKELRENARPELIVYPESLDDYDTVFVGYPNWWGTMPMAIRKKPSNTVKKCFPTANRNYTVSIPNLRSCLITSLLTK